MLTADLADPSVKKGALTITPLVRAPKTRALELATEILDVYWASRHESRRVLQSRLGNIAAGARELRRKNGLIKMLDDACRFGAPTSADYPAARAVVHAAVHAARRDAAGENIDAPAVGAAALAADTALGLSAPDAAAAVQNLYGDLKSAQLLEAAPSWTPAQLVALYEDARPAAVLLKARAVRATLHDASPDDLRRVIQTLRFRELLFAVEYADDTPDAPTLVIDGPFSLFSGRTKYGLRLALSLRALRAAGTLHLEAELAWGPGQKKRRFVYESKRTTGDDAPPPERPAILTRVHAALTATGHDPAWAQHLQVVHGHGVFCPALVVAGDPAVFIDVLDVSGRPAALRRIEQARHGGHRCVLVAQNKLKLSPKLVDDAPALRVVGYARVPDKKTLDAAVRALLAPG